MPARGMSDALGGSLGVPRDLLVPYVLLFLKNWSAHGYQILQTLTMMGFAAVDPATVYRTLRQMEREGLVLSSWEMSEAGPARRTYKITEQGEAFLAQWANALGAYQRFLDRFFELYAGGGSLTAAITDEPVSNDVDAPVTTAVNGHSAAAGRATSRPRRPKAKG